LIFKQQERDNDFKEAIENEITLSGIHGNND
jgi:hypothetical protein